MTGSDIKIARQASGLTQQEAAALLGVPKRTLQDWEDGKRKPKKGYERLTEIVTAFGILTEEGRKSVLEGRTSLDDVLSIYKGSEAKKLSKWGAYDSTYYANFRRIPEGITDKLTATEIAALVDSFKAAYDDGRKEGAK